MHGPSDKDIFSMMKRRKNSLFLHKDEWSRLKSVGASIQEPRGTNEYVQSLIEKSQQWINSWPDSVQGHILQLEKQKKKKHTNDIAMMKLFKKQQKEIDKKNQCIEKAKQIIFDDSSYGRRLISALIESKTLEERDAQIEFQKKIKEKAAADDVRSVPNGCSVQNAIDMEKLEKEQAESKRETDKAIARVNKNIYLAENERRKRERELQKQMEIEDLRIIAELKAKETIQEVNEKNLFKKDFEQFETERKQRQHRKELREILDERTAEIWRNYENKKNAVLKQMHAKRFQQWQPTKNYELIQKLNEEEENRYDEFVNKGITALTRRLQIKEEEENRQKLNERKNRHLLAQSNKKLENAKRITEIEKKILVCDRQCIIGRRKSISEVKPSPQKQNTATTLAPTNNELVKNLKIRETEPSPWSDLSAAHAQFARQAGRTLQECRYKYAARKVIDDYRRLHGLAPQDFHVDNYF